MADKIKILHCSDIHLCSELAFLKNKSKARRLEILNTFRNIVELCKKEAVELLLIAGDLFDSNHIDSETLRSIKNMFASVPKVKIAVVAGNHDYYAVDSPYSDDDWPENTVIFFNNFQKIEYPELNLRLCGSSFVSSYQEKKHNDISVPDDNMINIMVYHGDVVSDNQSSAYNPLTVSQIEKSNYDYIALGHIHTASQVLKAGNTSYGYSGTPDGNGFDETGKKGVYIGNVYKHRTDLKFYETSSRLYENVNFDVSSLVSNTQIAKSVIRKLETLFGEKYADNLYKLTLTGKSPEGFIPNSKLIQTELEETLFYINVNNNSKPDLNVDMLSSDFSLKGLFTKKMLEKISSCVSDEEKSLYENAMYIGLKAFDGEVSFYEH